MTVSDTTGPGRPPCRSGHVLRRQICPPRGNPPLISTAEAIAGFAPEMSAENQIGTAGR